MMSFSLSICSVTTHLTHRDRDLEYLRAGDLDLDLLGEGDLERLGDRDLVLDLEGLLPLDILLERDLQIKLIKHH